MSLEKNENNIKEFYIYGINCRIVYNRRNNPASFGN